MPDTGYFFLKKLAVSPVGQHFLPFAVQQIYAANGTVGIDCLTTQIHASRRYVEKLFIKPCNRPAENRAPKHPLLTCTHPSCFTII